MPYIKMVRRVEIDKGTLVGSDVPASPDNAGELNYAITKLLIRYCEENGLNYQRINDCMGAAQGAALEFYRRVAAPYERTKIAENGDLEYYKHFSPEG